MPWRETIDTDTFAKAGLALKALAADRRCRDGFAGSRLLQDLLKGPAGRYVVAEDRAGLKSRLELLASKGYLLGVEYVGEEVQSLEKVTAIEAEYLALIEELSAVGFGPSVQLGFDLSNVGMLLSRSLTVSTTGNILRQAKKAGISVMVSMERSPWVDQILDIFAELAPEHENLGLTVQAHLHRTPGDLDAILPFKRKIRLVKGVYAEVPEIALPHGADLDRRYEDILTQIVAKGNAVTVATQDPLLHERLLANGLLKAVTEVEMLHGVRPELLKKLKESGCNCRIATVYGEDWFLHFLHRLAEFPPNILVALADFMEPKRIEFGAAY